MLLALTVQALWKLGEMIFSPKHTLSHVAVWHIVFVLILAELYRTLIFYLRELLCFRCIDCGSGLGSFFASAFSRSAWSLGILVHIFSEGSMGAREQAQSSCRMAFIALALMLIYFAVDNHVRAQSLE